MKGTYTYMYLTNEIVEREVGIINPCRRGATDKELVDRRKGLPLPTVYDPVPDFLESCEVSTHPTKLMANHCYTLEEADLPMTLRLIVIAGQPSQPSVFAAEEAIRLT